MADELEQTLKRRDEASEKGKLDEFERQDTRSSQLLVALHQVTTNPNIYNQRNH